MSGYNVFTSCDCDRCMYGKTVKYNDEGFTCDSPPKYKCSKGEYQTRCVVSIVGSLRYFHASEVKKELLGVLKNFDDKFFVRNLIISLNDGMNEILIKMNDLKYIGVF